jgi:hypothetical protein
MITTEQINISINSHSYPSIERKIMHGLTCGIWKTTGKGKIYTDRINWWFPGLGGDGNEMGRWRSKAAK